MTCTGMVLLQAATVWELAVRDVKQWELLHKLKCVTGMLRIENEKGQEGEVWGGNHRILLCRLQLDGPSSSAKQNIFVCG